MPERDWELTDEQVSELGFETALARLEQLVADLEAGDLPLDRALVAFRLGVKLRDHCRRCLEAAEGLLVQLTADGDGQTSREETTL